MNGSGERRRFTVTTPDWGQDHLSCDAIVAYIDEELGDRPHSRATRHLDSCPDCLAQVAAQGQARTALRSADVPHLPSALLISLRAIPQDTELPGPPPGLAVTHDGQLVSVLRPEVRTGPAGPSSTGVAHGRRPQRRHRFGAGAAMSGLALGALALSAPSIADGPLPVFDRGVFDGAVLGSPSGAVEAKLRLTPTSGPDQLTARMKRMPASFPHLP